MPDNDGVADVDHGSIHLTVDSFDSTSGNVMNNTSGDNTVVISEGVEESAVIDAPNTNSVNYTTSSNTNSYSDTSVSGKNTGDGRHGGWSKNSYAEELVTKGMSSNTKTGTDSTFEHDTESIPQDDVSIADENKRENVFLKQHSYIGEEAIQGLNAVQGAVRQSPIAAELNSLPVQPAEVPNGDAWAAKPSALASQFQLQSYFTPVSGTNTTILRSGDNTAQRTAAASRDRSSPLVSSVQGFSSPILTKTNHGTIPSTAFQFFRASSTVMRVTEDGTVTDCSTDHRPPINPGTNTTTVRSVANAPKKSTTSNYDTTTTGGSPLRARSTTATGRMGNTNSAIFNGIVEGYDPYDDIYRPSASRAASYTRSSPQHSNVTSNVNTEVLTETVPLRSQPSVIQTGHEHFVVCVDTPPQRVPTAASAYISGVHSPSHAAVVGGGGMMYSTTPTTTVYDAPQSHYRSQQMHTQPQAYGGGTTSSVFRSTSQQRTQSNNSAVSNNIRTGTRGVSGGVQSVPGEVYEYQCGGDPLKSSGFANELAQSYDMVDSLKELLCEMALMANEVVLIKHPKNSRYQSYTGVPTDLADKGHVLSFSTIDQESGLKHSDSESGFEAVILWPKSDGVDTFDIRTGNCGTGSVQRLRDVGPTVSLKVTRGSNSRPKSGSPIR